MKPQNRLSDIPQVNTLLDPPAAQALVTRYGRGEVVAAVRRLLERLRNDMLAGAITTLPDFTGSDFYATVENDLRARRRTSLRRVINATGVILHTNLGRAPLSPSALRAMSEAAAGYSNLEFDLATGQRGSRHDHVGALLCELTGAEAALVVNNCAAAVLVSLAALAGPAADCEAGEVVVSRGELIEIGGAFRMPDVIAASGATMVEVGTTNKTHAADYAAKLGPQTRALLTTHPSNYRVVGFTAMPTLGELVSLAHGNDVPVIEDLGSGLLVDAEREFGIREPSVQHSIGADVDVVTFSGDKLLGGPQAGIIVGKKRWLHRIRQHPLMRAVRIDKLSLAALEATLQAYRPERDASTELPVLRMLTMDTSTRTARARVFAERLSALPGLSVTLRDGIGYVGGGTLPTSELPTTLLALNSDQCSAIQLQTSLRAGPVPVIGRIVDDRFAIDLRTVDDGELDDLFAAVAAVTTTP